jgi:MFS family permease
VKKGFAVSVMEYLKLGCVGVLVFWLTVLFTSYEGLVWAFEPLFSRYYDMSPLAAGVILSLFTVPFILFSIPAGVLADRYGKMRTLVPGLLLTGLFVMSFGLAGDFFTLALSALLSTTGLAFAWASTAGLLADSSKRLQKGYIAGVWSMSEGLGYLVGPVLGGLVGQYFSVKVPFVLLGAVFVVTAILLASRWWRYLLMLKLAPFRGQSS